MSKGSHSHSSSVMLLSSAPLPCSVIPYNTTVTSNLVLSSSSRMNFYKDLAAAKIPVAVDIDNVVVAQSKVLHGG